MKIYVFDLDGTIANLDHRLHYITSGRKNWDAFFLACNEDSPNLWIINLMRLCATDSNILILSGRNESVREVTQAWLNKHKVPICDLVMRPAKDFRSDDILKIEMLRAYLEKHPDFEVEFIVDDRQKVVDMWRREGFNVLQCNAWEEAPNAK